VRQVAAVIGGSLGGMFVLEWAYLGKDYIRCIVPIATSSRHSAWGISWGEAQRQSIYADPKYDDGYYPFDDPPSTGLGAARMAALLTYRSRNSFESRFGRNIPDPSKRQMIRETHSPSTPSEAHFQIHNDGHKVTRKTLSRQPSDGSDVVPRVNGESNAHSNGGETAAPAAARVGNGDSNTNGNSHTEAQMGLSADPQFHGPRHHQPSLTGGDALPTSTYFSAQSYLRYQGQKFVKRFDSNCYIAMTRKLDTHDVSRGRAPTIADALALIEQPTLVLGIESDGLFTFAEQEEIAEHVRDARLERIESAEGHDAFLLQFEQVNHYILGFLREALPDIMAREGDSEAVVEASVGEMSKSSTFGEAEVGDITAW
jgi:homoserine O-acetyltransferase